MFEPIQPPSRPPARSENHFVSTHLELELSPFYVINNSITYLDEVYGFTGLYPVLMVILVLECEAGQGNLKVVNLNFDRNKKALTGFVLRKTKEHRLILHTGVIERSLIKFSRLLDASTINSDRLQEFSNLIHLYNLGSKHASAFLDKLLIAKPFTSNKPCYH